MQRLANIIFVADLNSKHILSFEKALRHSARVITIGKSNKEMKRFVDFESEGRPDLLHFCKQLPENLQPDLLIWMQPVVELIPVNVQKISCQTLAIVEQAWEGLEEYLSLFRVRCSIKLDTARSLNIPYVPLWKEDDESPKLSHTILNEIYQFTIERKAIQAPEHYLNLLNEVELENNTSNSFQSSGRSFIIPVLDESPTSPYSIKTLLEDLEYVEGEVICIFNDPEVARKYHDHDRVNEYAIMSRNIGVGRAWNAGVLLSKQPILFFLNADLHIGAGGINNLSEQLCKHPGVAAVGPCGGFFDFAQSKDLYYLDPSKQGIQTLVDQISFQYFAMPRKIFSEFGFQFYHDYLPCFMEEWDSALKLRQLGFSLLRVPLNDFEHQMGGSANKDQTISCLGQDYDMTKALEDNRRQYKERWAKQFPDHTAPYFPNIY